MPLKAVALAGQVASVGPELLVERLLNDPDARVRANTIEVLESRKDRQFLPAATAKRMDSEGRARMQQRFLELRRLVELS